MNISPDNGKTRPNTARRTGEPLREQQTAVMAPLMQAEAISSEREGLLRSVLSVLALAAVDQELRHRLDARRASASARSELPSLQRTKKVNL